MKLYYSPTSPFVRKVRLTAAVLGLTKEIEIVPVDVYGDIEKFKRINPLIKIPALETRAGQILTNSPFICQYLASLCPGSGFWPQNDDLWKVLNFQSIADGGMEAAVLRRYEILRTPDKFDKKFDEKQKLKVQNALEFLGEHLAELSSQSLGLAEASTICFVDYLQLRYAHEGWKHAHPRLFAWVAQWNEKSWVKESSPL